MDDLSQYKEMYVVESAEHLQSMNEALLSLEKEPENSETINVMFRSAHTLKGMSATMGYSNIATLTHEMENLMDRVRKGEMKLEGGAIDVLFECLDALEKMADEPENSSQHDISALLEKISSISKTHIMEKKQPVEIDVGSTTSGAAVEQTPAEDGVNVFNVTITLHESCLLKSARSSVVLRNISEIGKIIETKPSVESLENEKFDREFSIVVSTKEDAKKIEDCVKKVSEITSVEVKPHNHKGASKGIKEPGNENARNAIKSVQSVRVSIERLESLMNLVEELVITKIRLLQLSNLHRFNVLEETLANLNRLTNDLQEEITAARMVPIEQIFQRFPRMVRDLAKKEGKDIDLLIEGGDIELDRTVLDEVGDPLVHILRNCVDHGIELPEEREKLSKNPEGTIRLTARREKNFVIIEAEDDGRGMHPDKIRESAVKKGLMTKEEAQKLSDNDAINLCFAPGFSTAEKITDVSGRGVGLDVVKTKIEGLSGSIKLESWVGKGTKITLKLPLTIAIIQSLMVKVSGEIYAIPITNVIRDLAINKSQIKTIKGEEVILLRDEVLPLVRLHKLFGRQTNGHEDIVVVVVERKGSNIGLVVDQLIGQQEVIIKNFDNRFLKRIKGFAGATIMGDGNVALIIDVGTIL